MIQDLLRKKYGNSLKDLDIYENRTSLILTRIIINPEKVNNGIGTSVMNDIINYADTNKQIVALTPSNDFGGDKNRLVQFYKKFGFRMNQGHNKSYEFQNTMIRYPKMNETKILIKTLLRENINKTSIKESLLTKKISDITKVSEFVNFAKKFLAIDDDIQIELAFERTPDLKTTAYYHPVEKRLKVYVKDRAIIDVCRSIAHELVHHKQNLEGRILDTQTDGNDGSPIENEANALAGVIIRKWGKLKPEIYN